MVCPESYRLLPGESPVLVTVLIACKPQATLPATGALTDKSEPKKTRAGGSQHRPPGQGNA